MKMRILLPVMLLTANLVLSPAQMARAAVCTPTEPDALGPFYKAGAPVRSSVGTGYVLSGTIRSSRDCSIIAGALIELWLAGPAGGYDDAHRASVIADGAGAYRFISNRPQPYEGRPPHIHLRVSAKGFTVLVTQHYPEKGAREAVFDVVLKPDR